MDANRNFSANPNEYTELSSIGLTRGKVGGIKNGRGVRLRVESGAVWVTQEGCSDDVILEAGQTYRLATNGLALVVSLNGRFALATLEPSIPVRPTMGARFWKFWAGLYAPESCPTTAAL